MIKCRIMDIYKQNWHAQISESNRLSSYGIYKNNSTMETYLDHISVNKFRYAVTKFRLSSHDLAIEQGKYTNIERTNRHCEHCNLNIIENEYHFLLVCPKYRHLRLKYFKPYFCHWPSIKKFELLISPQSRNRIVSVSKYLYYAFKLRSE